MEIKDVKNILIFKLCCFGDIMFLTPTISALNRNIPEAKTTLIASSWIANLGNYLKHVDEVIIFNDVFVPWERVFLCGEVEYAVNMVIRFSSFHRQSHGPGGW